MKDILKTIDKVSAAFPKWSAKSAQERSKILLKWNDLILADKKRLAKIMHDESAKLMPECLAEVDYAASFISWYAKEALRERNEKIDGGYITHQPIGPVAAITPWNFPAAMITRKVAPALAAGCTVLSKPSELTPNTAIALQKLGRKAGFGVGVFEIVVGDSKKIGKIITDSLKIKKLSFTGSTAVGAQLIAQCAPTIKKVTMELGGNAPFVIFADADLDAAVEAAVKSRFRFSGQTCICANRFLVEADIYDKFIEKMQQKISDMEIAPLIHEEATKKVEKLVKGAIKEGAKLIHGTDKADGRYFAPTILANVTAKMEIFSKEIFGPVVTVIKFKGAEQAIKLANDTEYGLAAYVYCGDAKTGEYVAKSINAGMVGLNDIAINIPSAPFGGMNHSGIGREGSHFGIEEYFEIKFIATKTPIKIS